MGVFFGSTGKDARTYDYGGLMEAEDAADLLAERNGEQPHRYWFDDEDKEEDG